jgi:hypothetical protein
MLVLTMAIYFGKRVQNQGELAGGTLSAIIGLSLFIDSLRVCVMPLGERLGRDLPKTVALHCKCIFIHIGHSVMAQAHALRGPPADESPYHTVDVTLPPFSPTSFVTMMIHEHGLQNPAKSCPMTREVPECSVYHTASASRTLS